LIDRDIALARIDDIDIEALTDVSLVSAGKPAAAGTGASGGIAVGRAAFDSESAQRLAAAGDPVILMRPDTSTADVAGFSVASGIVTAVGARTAHAALVARQMGKPCIVGCGAMNVEATAGRATLGQTSVSQGDWITIDGDTGGLFLGRCETVVTRPEAELAEIARWRSEAGDHPHRKPKLSHRV